MRPKGSDSYANASFSSIPGPRRKASNRRIPSARELKRLIPKKRKNQRKLEIPDEPEGPTQLDGPEEGYWDTSGTWVEAPPRPASGESHREEKEDSNEKENDEKEDSDGHSDDDDEAHLPSPDDASRRLRPPLQGYRSNGAQRILNSATTSSSDRTGPVVGGVRSTNTFSTNSIRYLYEADSEALFHSRGNSSSDEDIEYVEQAIPFNITQRSSGRTPNPRLSGSTLTSRVPDSVPGHSYLTHSPASQQRRQRLREAGIEDEVEEEEEEGEATHSETQGGKNRAVKPTKIKTYSKRHNYAYAVPVAQHQPYSQPTPSQIPNQLPPGRNPSLRSSSSHRSTVTDDCSEGETELTPSLGIENPDEFTWTPSLEAVAGRRHPIPVNYVPVTTAFPQHRYFLRYPHLPPLHPGYRFHPQVLRDYNPKFEAGPPPPRLMFTQSMVNVKSGTARNKPLGIPKPKNAAPRRAPSPKFLDPFPRITVEELHERYRLRGYHFPPVDHRLLKASTLRPEPTHRAPQWHDPPRNPIEPRIVHPSDVPSEAISSFTQHTPYNTGRLALRKGKEKAQAPRLRFTAEAPPSPPSLVTSGTSGSRSHAANNITPMPGDASRLEYSSRTPDSASRQSQSGPTPGYRHSTQSQPPQQSSPHSSYPDPPRQPKGILKSPFISQIPSNTPILRQPNQPSFIPYIPIEAEHDDQEPDERHHPEKPEERHHPDEYEDVEGHSENEMVPLVHSGKRGGRGGQPFPSSSKSKQVRTEPHVDDIEEFDSERYSQPAQHLRQPIPTQPPQQSTPRKPLGDITSTVSTEHLSGIHITDHLLSIASREAEMRHKRSSGPQQRRMEERRQRVEAQRRAAAAAARGDPGPSGTTGLFAGPSAPSNTNPISLHPRHSKSYRHVGPVSSQRAPHSRLYPSKSQPTQIQEDTPGFKRTKSTVTSQFKQPRRIDATPSPQPTIAELLHARLATSFPGYARVFPVPQAPPGPPPPRLGIVPRPLKRARTQA